MADMSQNEKRAAGWRKLKKYQQHKTSTSTAKSNKKNAPSSSEQNREPYSFYKGFSDPQMNMESYLSPEQTVECKGLDIPDYSSSELMDPHPTNESSNLHVPLISGDELNVPLQSLPSVTKAQTVPIFSDIFANSYSPVKSNFSDFFDNLKSSPECDSTKDNSVTNQMYSATNICTAENGQEQEASSNPSESKLQVSNEKVNNSADINVSEEIFDVSSSNTNFCTEVLPKVTDAICKNVDDVSSVNVETNLASSAENLRQLSLELSGLIDSSVTSSDSHSTQMERRNQELAALYANEKEKCEKLQMQMIEMESQVSNLRAELFQHQTDAQVKFQQELSPIREQLQLHVQTVGILVGEKTELEAALSKSQQTAKQKAVEVEELQGRLKASRHRVSELEREVSSINISAKQMEATIQQQSKDLLRLKLEKEMITKQLEESDEEASELRQNLDVQSGEVLKLRQELQEKVSQLDLAQLRIQQLSLSDSTDVEKQLESLHQQKVGLERQVAELQQSIQTVGTERDQANNQYQEYIHHVNSHLKNMADKLAAATAENEQLTNREQSLVKHLSELEKQLQLQQQQQQQQQRNHAKDSPLHGKETEHLQKLEKSFSELQDEKEKIAIDLDCQVQENKSLKDQLEMYIGQVEKLEVMIENLKADQPDSQKLLEAMESDKVAAARAVEQNQKLKAQLEELQEGFIQMTNNKLDLTEQLQKEQMVSKELAERLAQKELDISELRTQVTENEMRMENLPNNTEAENENVKAQIHSIQDLENEINQYKKQCQSLQNENEDLKMKLTHNHMNDTPLEDGKKDSIIENLKASVCQLTMERDQLLLQRSDFKPHTVHKATDSPDNSFNQDVNITEYSNLKEAMEKLQDRFTKTMEEVAELSDEKQRLEHLVLQLQGETETIGEYIALYQKQRIMLRQRAQEKDEQLARLARDREEVKIKLNELNRLIGQLVAENGLKGTNLNVANSDVPIEADGSNETLSNVEGLTNGDITSKKTLDSSLDSEIHHESNLQVKPGKTADKIIALLSEIESSTLVEPRGVESFHPCPWCSGRLITV